MAIQLQVFVEHLVHARQGDEVAGVYNLWFREVTKWPRVPKESLVPAETGKVPAPPKAAQAVPDAWRDILHHLGLICMSCYARARGPESRALSL